MLKGANAHFLSFLFYLFNTFLKLVCPSLRTNKYQLVTYFPRIIYWNLPWFGFKELTVNHINTFFKSIRRLVKILLDNLLQEYIVLSSAKLQLSHLKTKKNKSLMKILNKKGPRIDPWGIPQIIFHHSPNTGTIFVFCP